MSDTIPILDLGPLLSGEPGALDRLGGELRRAFTEVGFYFVRNHGVPPGLVDAAFAAAARFHAQPLEAKLAMPFDQNNQGYLPMRGNTSRMNAVEGVKKPNANEAVFFKRELPPDHPDVLAGRRFRGVNQWPAALPGFRETALEYSAAMETLGRRLVPIYAAALNLPHDWFDDKFREPMFTLRMTHYPQQEPTAAEDEWGLAPHADTSFMTILAQNKVPGLSLRLPDGRWIDAPALEGCFLVNGGMMLRRWTNNLFLATPHRVTNRSGQERYAIPFFMDCSYDAVMAPIPTCVTPEKPARHKPFTYLEFMSEYSGANYGERGRSAAGVELQGA
ncbi:2OG-Fe(II) oxygenase [Siccirubricoccus deserti]|uniref:2-oxoglutarate-dependent ethylene/succinate-forming enzyme n=1 Tax=Siccirubricoccus deserti TaxID=2013562 RepID=A0A9X0QZE1_9PROT|nr:isopenicillin N synthase family oxygenase [Siccirubricoccus deserti]MBC4016700.1 isopenicillin N synthase family oxygenase [Siccirubricoccus deserti]GGC51204.1 2OG-Fe(II) oxygenase [Siccirubricoccus deserti]